MNNETSTLRQLITERMTALEKELKTLRGVIEAMGDRPIRNSEFESLRLQVFSLVEGLNELEQRVGDLEQHKSLANWVFRQAVTIGVLIALIYVLGVWK